MKKLPALLFLLVALPVYADTIVSGTITTDATWSPAGGVYFIDSSFSVAVGTTLTIEPGTIIKARTTGQGGPSVYGRLIAHGTGVLPIRFTSSTDTGPGEWQGLYFKPGSTGSLEYVDLSNAGYGGFGFGNFVGIENDGGNIDIKHSHIHDNHSTISGSTSGFGIRNKGLLSISDSTIGGQVFGIFSDSGTVTLTNNEILNNTGMGLQVSGTDTFTLVGNRFTGNAKTAQVSASVDFIHEGNTSTDLSARGFESVGTARDGAIWHSRDLPLLITQGYLMVLPGRTLTIEPGTIVKLGSSFAQGMIIVNGNLDAQGTSLLPIYFTSYKDDSIGGDTNANGEANAPLPRDWQALLFESGASGVFDNVKVRYGGQTLLIPGTSATFYNRGADLEIKNSFIGNNFSEGLYQNAGNTLIDRSEFTHQGSGIRIVGGDLSVGQSSFHNNISYGVENTGVNVVDARNNWWGSETGPHDTSTSTPTGTGDGVSDNVLYNPWLTSDPTLEPPEQHIDPVIIIPGIMGSAYKNGELVIDPILHTYDDLIATLDENGYTLGVDLFTFPYEWRDSNVFTANLLDGRIEQIKSICDCDKLDIVAHSMGGLVARSYIQSVDYDGDVDQIIFLGTPHKGSVIDYIKWEAGQFIPEFFDTLQGMFFQAEAARNGYLTVFGYIRNRPILSVQELLPTFNYLKDKNTGIVRIYPSNYPRNFFLESLNSNISNLLNSGVEITNITGDTGINTAERIRVIPSTTAGLWQHGEPDGFSTILGDQGLENGTGDGTVTTFGATLDSSISNEDSSASHKRLPTVEENNIFKILTGETATTNIDSGFNISPIILLLQLKSPIDVVVTAPDGKKIGKNFSSGAQYNEIPLAFHSGFDTDEEYITILNPLDGEYKVELQGTGNGGEYGVLTSYISDSFATTTETTGITKPNQVTNLNVEIDSENPSNLVSEREITLEVLINDINGAYDLGWIKDKKIRDQLIKKVQKIYKNDKKKDKRLAKALALDLKLYRKGKINEQAYNLIKTDLEWLINN